MIPTLLLLIVTATSAPDASKVKKLKQVPAADDPYLAQVRNLVSGGKS